MITGNAVLFSGKHLIFLQHLLDVTIFFLSFLLTQTITENLLCRILSYFYRKSANTTKITPVTVWLDHLQKKNRRYAVFSNQDGYIRSLTTPHEPLFTQESLYYYTSGNQNHCTACSYRKYDGRNPTVVIKLNFLHTLKPKYTHAHTIRHSQWHFYIPTTFQFSGNCNANHVFVWQCRLSKNSLHAFPIASKAIRWCWKVIILLWG